MERPWTTLEGQAMPDITGAQATPIPKKKYWKPRKLHQVCMGDCSPPWNSANQHVTKVTPTRRFFDKSVKCEILKIVKPHENEKCTIVKNICFGILLTSFYCANPIVNAGFMGVMNIYAMECVWLHFIKGKPIVKKPCGRRL